MSILLFIYDLFISWFRKKSLIHLSLCAKDHSLMSLLYVFAKKHLIKLAIIKKLASTILAHLRTRTLVHRFSIDRRLCFS